MTGVVRLLAVLGRINPAIWDWIVPMGPIRQLVAGGSVSKAAQVELNPQPIPPGHELLVASAIAAHQIALATVAAEAAGTKSAGRIVTRAIDDWCGTPHGWPPIPWPGPWPFPWPPDPDPHPWDVAASRVVGALTLAGVASRLGEGEAQAALSRGAEQLLEAGLAE